MSTPYLKYWFLFISVTTGALAWSQDCLWKGRVLDIEGVPIEFATVQLIDDASQNFLSYAITGAEGDFELRYAESPANHTLIIVTNHLNYRTDSTYFRDHPCLLLDTFMIVLEVRENQLSQVLIEGNATSAKINGDTINYNLGAYTTGQERTVYDLLDKLPGIEIKDNGKITANGKEVSSLLVDDKEVLGDNYEILGKSMSSEMLAGVQLIDDYDHLLSSEQSAINLQIKEEYKNKITGDLEAMGGVESRHLAHLNAYRFSEKLSLVGIADANDIARPPIDMRSYLIRKISNDFGAEKGGSYQFDENDLPPYLTQDPSKNESSNSNLGSLDATYLPSKKWKINTSMVWIGLEAGSRFQTQRTFITGSDNVLSRDSSTLDSENSLFELSGAVDYKANSSTRLRYTYDFNTVSSDIASDLTSFFDDGNSIISYRDIIDRTATNINNKVDAHHQFSEKLQLRGIAYYTLFSQKSQLDLFSNTSIIDLDQNAIKQRQKRTEERGGLESSLRYNIGEDYSLKFSVGLTTNSQDIDLTNDPIELEEASPSELKYTETYATLTLLREANKLQFGVSGSHHRRSIKTSLQDNTAHWFWTTRNWLKFVFSDAQFLEASFQYDRIFPDQEHIIDGIRFVDTRNVFTGSTIEPQNHFHHFNPSLRYFLFDIFNGITFFANWNYDYYSQEMGKNYDFFTNYTRTEYAVLPESKQHTGLLSFEKKLFDIKHALKLSSRLWQRRNFISTEGDVSSSMQRNLSFDVAINSVFSEGLLNYQLQGKWARSTSLFDANDREAKVDLTEFSVKVYGERKEITYNVSAAYQIFVSSTANDQHIVDLGFRLGYNLDKKWEFFVSGENILNLNSPVILELLAQENFQETRETFVLPGYLGLGFKYKWP